MAYVTSVIQEPMHDIALDIIAHANSDPCSFEGWRTMGPTPLAFTIHQMKNTMPAVGATIAFRVKR